ncbi:hypothetical protein AAG570_007957 [Ranatra chinensis]|uniref:Aminotransferase class I/classII domain-containing protein n=1 Tax=Ranatra chinensis TaxID=642074 RepID=A0ABD0XTD0_9HEMI
MLKHFKSVREFYRMKRDQMLSAVTKHLTGLAEWCVPDGGLFLWLKLNGIEDTYEMAMNRCIKNSLVIIPGHPFTSFGPGRPCPYIRLSYSMVTPSQMDQVNKFNPIRVMDS